MKLEPVAWMTHESQRRLKDGGNCKGAVPAHQQRSHASSIPLYAIPDGHVVVPVDPSRLMIECGVMALCADRGPDEYNIRVVYHAMIAAKEQQ